MRNKLRSFWQNYKFRFVPWIIYNLKQKKFPEGNLNHGTSLKPSSEEPVHSVKQSDIKSNDLNIIISPEELSTSKSNPLIVHHVRGDEENLIDDDTLRDILVRLFDAFEIANGDKTDKVARKRQKVMHEVLGYSIARRKSLVSKDAGVGVFLSSGHARPGSLIALYPGTIYMPSEPLFFPSIANPFIFRCSDGIHIDGNDKWISKSIYESCSARDKFRMDLPCCDDSWLTLHPRNPLNIGQYVNNRSKSTSNNVIYQESSIILEGSVQNPQSTLQKEFPIRLCKYLPNVWANPANNHFPLKLVPLVAVKDIREGDEILSSYFTVLHPNQKKRKQI